MRAKVAKFLRKISRIVNKPVRAVKKKYNKIPSKLRHKVIIDLQQKMRGGV